MSEIIEVPPAVFEAFLRYQRGHYDEMLADVRKRVAAFNLPTEQADSLIEQFAAYLDADHEAAKRFGRRDEAQH